MERLRRTVSILGERRTTDRDGAANGRRTDRGGGLDRRSGGHDIIDEHGVKRDGLHSPKPHFPVGPTEQLASVKWRSPKGVDNRHIAQCTHRLGKRAALVDPEPDATNRRPGNRDKCRDFFGEEFTNDRSDRFGNSINTVILEGMDGVANGPSMQERRPDLYARRQTHIC